MMGRGWMLLLILFAAMGFSGIASAGLIKIGTATYEGNDYNLIYEDDQRLIWLDYTNPGNLWPKQMKWVAGLNNSGVLTYKLNPGVSVIWEGDWRLPKAVDGPRIYGFDGTTTAGFNITTSEMGHLYYVSLGNLGYFDRDGNPRSGWGGPRDKEGWGLKNTDPFTKLQSNFPYWTSTIYSAYTMHAWDFNMYFGSQEGSVPMRDVYPWLAIAVRPGRIVSAPSNQQR